MRITRLESCSELAPVLIAETDRGVVLIGTTHVDKHLKEMIHSFMPTRMPEADIINLLRYSGALGSFGSRKDIAYTTCLINQKLYAFLNALRKVSNDAAHAAKPFDLNTQEYRICELYDLGPGVSGAVTARKDDAPAAYQAAITNLADLAPFSGRGGLIQTTSG